MTRQERRFGIFMLLLGVAVIFYVSSQLKIGDLTKPGPGFFPLICAIGIIIITAIWVGLGMRAKAKNEPLWEKGQLIGPLKALIVITVYTAIMETLGYILSTFIFLIAWQFIVESEKWKKTAIIAVVGTAAMYMLFSYLLSVPLPVGMLGI